MQAICFPLNCLINSFPSASLCFRSSSNISVGVCLASDKRLELIDGNAFEVALIIADLEQVDVSVVEILPGDPLHILST